MKTIFGVIALALLAAPMQAENTIPQKLDSPTAKQLENANAGAPGNRAEEAKAKSGNVVNEKSGEGAVKADSKNGFFKWGRRHHPDKEDKKKEEIATHFSDLKVPPKAAEPPPLGVHEAKPDKALDANRWNVTIAGVKTAVVGGLLGYIFAGPAGLVVAAALGFGAGYFMKKMNDS
jgi:hypothetical protein